MKKLLKSSLFSCLVSILPLHANAEFYVGGGIGLADYEELDDNPMSFEITAGYQFNDYLALQLLYLDLGEAENTIEELTLNYGLVIDGFNFSL